MAQETHTITIHCNNGEFSYEVVTSRPVDGNTPRINDLDYLEFKCDHLFAVHFGWDSPFAECQYEGDAHRPIKLQVPYGAKLGEYKYSVAVFDKTELWTDDPRFIIRP